MLKPAFTMIEMMVTISLAVFVLTISGVSYRVIATRNEIILEANQIAVDIRQAQTFAASGKELNNVAGHNVWGLYVDEAIPDQYIIFNDSDNNGRYTPGEEYRTVKLASPLIISDAYSTVDIAGVATRLSSEKISVVFTPPDPQVTIVNADGTEAGDNFYLVIQDRNDANKSNAKVVTVNFFGLIDAGR